jgi:SAD/SRA domain
VIAADLCSERAKSRSLDFGFDSRCPLHPKGNLRADFGQYWHNPRLNFAQCFSALIPRKNCYSPGMFSIEVEPGVFIGEVPGVPVGSTFADRRALHDRGVHRGLMKGIAKAGSSIVLSGGYVDDEDVGDSVIYTGEGGRDPNTGAQIGDQELSRGNLALVRNYEEGLPVRVVRGHNHPSPFAPPSGYRYDGLFRIDRFGVTTGRMVSTFSDSG